VVTVKEAVTDLALLVAATKENLAVDMVQHQVPKVAENADIKINYGFVFEGVGRDQSLQKNKNALGTIINE